MSGSDSGKLAHQNYIACRRRARRLGMQALFAMIMADKTAAEATAEFESQHDFAKADTAYFRQLVIGTEKYRTEIDQALAPCLDRSISVLTPIELVILRMALFELMYQIDVPYKAVINEAVNLAAKFGADQSFKYVNGVLDRAAASLRRHETGLAQHSEQSAPA